MKYKIVSVWTSGKPYEFTADNGENVKLVSYFLEVSDGSSVKKVYINQKPDSEVPKEAADIDLEITDRMNKKGTHFKAKKKQQFPDLKCPSCSFSGPLQDFKQPKPDAKPVARPEPDDDGPPAENYDQIPFA